MARLRKREAGRRRQGRAAPDTLTQSRSGGDERDDLNISDPIGREQSDDRPAKASSARQAAVVSAALGWLNALTADQRAAAIAMLDEADDHTSHADVVAAFDRAGIPRLTISLELRTLAALDDAADLSQA